METKQEETLTQKLERLGMKQAVINIKEKVLLKRKLALAYEHYRFVTEEKIKEFKNKIYMESYNKRNNLNWMPLKEFKLTPLQNYQEIPPKEVLDSLEEAMGRQCFDYYEIGHIVAVKDPILFGCVRGCTDRFFIAQWDNDCRIEDILRDNEG